MKKILVIGGSSLLGSRVAEQACSRFKVYATYASTLFKIEGCDFYHLDITKRKEIQNFIIKICPDFVVHMAALTDVDYCEDHHEEAWMTNVEGTRNVVNACKEIDAKIIYVSTDYVFDGTKGSYEEEDVTNPINFYGKTKLEGEKIVKDSGLEYAIGRVNVVYGWNRSGQRLNFATWVIDSLKKQKRISIASDQYSNPTFADNGAKIFLAMIEKGAYGTFHACGKECVDRFTFTRKIASHFHLPLQLISPKTTEKLAQRAPRPKRNCLNVSKVEKEIGTTLFTVDQGLEEMKKQLEEHKYEVEKIEITKVEIK